MNLPEGYSVKEEPHFTFLYSGTERIAIFPEGTATAEEIEEVIREHYKEQKEK